MKLSIAGSRNERTLEEMVAIVTQAIPETLWVWQVVSGHCPASFDMAGEEWARRTNLMDSIILPARFKYGHVAALVRNECLMDVADGLIAFHDGKSRGTTHIINVARERGKLIDVVLV